MIFPADRVRLLTREPQRRLQVLSNATSSEVIWPDTSGALPEPWDQRPPADAEALERWRLKQGWPSGDGELSGETNPFELGLSHWVSLSKGCYLGQETMAKLASTGGVKQQLRVWSSFDLLAKGTMLQRDGAQAGQSSVLPTVMHPAASDWHWCAASTSTTVLNGPKGKI